MKALRLYALVVMLFVLLGSFALLLLPPVTSLVAGFSVNDGLSALSHDELVAVAVQAEAYVANLPGGSMPIGSDYRTAFTPDVVAHMEDVRRLFAVLEIGFLLVLVLLLALVLHTWRSGWAGSQQRREFGWAWLAGGVAALVLTVLCVVAGLLNFDALFAWMHSLFFASGSWTFAQDSLLICVYPLHFWMAMAAIWAVLLLLLASIAILIGWRLRRQPHRQPQG